MSNETLAPATDEAATQTTGEVYEDETRGKIETPYGKVKLYGVKEKGLDRARRVLVVPGYSETITHNKALVDALSQEGYDAITFNQPSKIDKDSEINPIDRQAEVLITLIESLTTDEEKINLAAHSLGSAVTLRAAKLNPELFKRVESVTLMQPIAEEQSFPEQLQRVGKKVVKNQAGTIKGQDPHKVPEKRYAARIDKESAYRYFGRTALAQVAGGVALARNPKLGYREARAAGGYTSLAEDIKKIENQGVKVNVITSYSDEMYDLTTTWDDVSGDTKVAAEGRKVVHPGYSALAHTSATVSTIADRGARHDAFWQQPRRTAEIIKQVIDPDIATEQAKITASENYGKGPYDWQSKNIFNTRGQQKAKRTPDQKTAHRNQTKSRGRRNRAGSRTHRRERVGLSAYQGSALWGDKSVEVIGSAGKDNGHQLLKVMDTDGNTHEVPKTNLKSMLQLEATTGGYDDSEQFVRFLENLDLFDTSDETSRVLVEARTRLAEASVETRRGKLLGNRQNRHRLDRAMADYEAARSACFQNLFKSKEVKAALMTDKRAFIARLSAREIGALMGEEANYYLELNSDGQRTWLDKAAESYSNLGKKGKIAVGVGALAAGSAMTFGVGLAAAGAGVSAAVASRFGRNWFTNEAKRRAEKPSTEKERQQVATLYKGNRPRYESEYLALQNATKDSAPDSNIDGMLAISEANAMNIHESGFDNIVNESDREAWSKRKAIGKAAGMVAVGASAGAIINNFDTVRGWFDFGGAEDTETGQPPVESVDPSAEEPHFSPEDQAKLDELERELQEMAEADAGTDVEPIPEPEPTPEPAPEAAAETISERNQHLFGELAGETVNIEIPEGGNIWDQLEVVVDAEAPGTGFQEKQRLVGNMLNKLQEQNPGRDLNLVSPGENFSIQLPA